MTERRTDPPIDAWALCAEFVEQMCPAHAEAANGSSEDVPEVDWTAIWRSGDGAPSDEAAIGRIVRAASDAAQAISRHHASRRHRTPALLAGCWMRHQSLIRLG